MHLSLLVAHLQCVGLRSPGVWGAQTVYVGLQSRCVGCSPDTWACSPGVWGSQPVCMWLQPRPLPIAHLLQRALLHRVEHRPRCLPQTTLRGVGGGRCARGGCRHAIARRARRACLVIADRGGEEGELAELRVDGAADQSLRGPGERG